MRRKNKKACYSKDTALTSAQSIHVQNYSSTLSYCITNYSVRMIDILFLYWQWFYKAVKILQIFMEHCLLWESWWIYFFPTKDLCFSVDSHSPQLSREEPKFCSFPLLHYLFFSQMKWKKWQKQHKDLISVSLFGIFSSVKFRVSKVHNQHSYVYNNMSFELGPTIVTVKRIPQIQKSSNRNLSQRI